ncbi:MAG: hypothetical protein HZB51_03255 [Chloroflexi bacterium]|nr:hypothetical protein [Chloroflexota bacterium]
MRENKFFRLRLSELAIGLMLSLLLAACSTATPTPSPTPSRVPSHTATPSVLPSQILTSTPTLAALPTTAATPIRADVVLSLAQHQQETTVKVGQILNVQSPSDLSWNIGYRSEILLALTPADKLKQPGTEGWFFRVIAPGNTTIQLESIAPPCLGPMPCPPNIMRLQFPIKALP